MRHAARHVAALLAITALAGCGGSSGEPAVAHPTAAATAGNTEVFLTLSGGSGSNCFNVYWSTSAGVTPANGNRLRGQCTGYRHGGLTNGVTYHYVLVEVVNDAEGWTSPELTATPNGPTNVAAGLQAGTLTVTWDPVAGATSYYVYWTSTPLGALVFMNRDVGATSPHVRSGIGVGPYYVRVSAVVGGVESPASPELEATQIP